MARTADSTLYDFGPSGPVLHGTRCRACRAVDFPPSQWGCEHCGATDQADAVTLAATGVVLAAVTVAAPNREAYAVAEIALDDGPMIHGIVERNVVAGDRVAASWVDTKVDADGEQLVEPRFHRAV